ncbi:MAG: secondary thiamine-phosphate synthase enzyme YjbQ [Smithella sp.]|jgi:secondary thiamine-phosphate synthase enzyme
MKEISLQTHSRVEMIDITAAIQKAVGDEKIEEGICLVYTPHTTAAVTINENADPDVPRDIISALEKIVPQNANYKHAEGNSPAHIKSSLTGASEMVIIENGRLVLGKWQSIFFCEFDGPRTRKFIVKPLSV